MKINKIIVLITLIGLLSSFSAASGWDHWDYTGQNTTMMCFPIAGDRIQIDTIITNNQVENSTESLYLYGYHYGGVMNNWCYRYNKSFEYNNMFDYNGGAPIVSNGTMNPEYIQCIVNRTEIDNSFGNSIIKTCKIGYFIRNAQLNIPIDVIDDDFFVKY